jgi:hypothetical protein
METSGKATIQLDSPSLGESVLGTRRAYRLPVSSPFPTPSGRRFVVAFSPEKVLPHSLLSKQHFCSNLGFQSSGIRVKLLTWGTEAMAQ